MTQTGDRSVLITGCSSGIGLCVAGGLKARGYRVFATARRQADVERLVRDGFESLTLDLDDTGSIAPSPARRTGRSGDTRGDWARSRVRARI